MKFLTRARRGVEYQMSDARVASGKNTSPICYVTGKALVTRTKVSDLGGGTKSPRPCLACADTNNGDGNKESNHMMDKCELWNSFTTKEKESKVRCKKHIFSKDHNTSDCQRDIKPCNFCQRTNHHFLLCHKYRKLGSCTAVTSVTKKSTSHNTKKT